MHPPVVTIPLALIRLARFFATVTPVFLEMVSSVQVDRTALPIKERIRGKKKKPNEKKKKKKKRREKREERKEKRREEKREGKQETQ